MLPGNILSRQITFSTDKPLRSSRAMKLICTIARLKSRIFNLDTIYLNIILNKIFLSAHGLSNYILLLSILLVCMNSFNGLMINALASSPSFPRQLEVEGSPEWRYFPLSAPSNCTGTADSVQIPHMTGVSYFSDGKFLNATIWLSDILKIKPIPTAIRIPTYTLGIGIIQSYNTSAKVDYAVTVQWNPLNQTWSSTLLEFLANGTRILQQDDNYTEFDNIEKKGYVNLSLDLNRITSPSQYFMTFLAFDTDVSKRPICGLVDNMGHLVYVPPPDFSISVFPNPLLIKQGEEKTIELRANSDSLVKPLLSFSKPKETENLEISISPNITYIPAGGLATSLVKVKADDDAEPGPYNIGIYSNISFPITLDATALLGAGKLSILQRLVSASQQPLIPSNILELDSETTIKTQSLNQSLNASILDNNNASSVIFPRPSYFSVIVNSYSLEDRFKDFWNTYGDVIGLISGGFAAGFSALIIDRVRKQRKNRARRVC